MKDYHVAALILAGGEGNRMGRKKPKQYIKIAGRSMLSFTLTAFEKHPAIEHIYVVCQPTWTNNIQEEMQAQGISKLCSLFPAGETAIDSLRNGITGMADHISTPEKLLVMVHDAVRPLVSQQVITDNLSIAKKYGNAVSCIQSQEAYLRSDNGLQATGLIERDVLWRAQTPMTFSLYTLQRLMREADKKNITQSQSLVTMMNSVLPQDTIHIATGSPLNFKITYPHDMQLLEAIINP